MGRQLQAGGDLSASRFILGAGPRALMCRAFSGYGRIASPDQVTLEGTFRTMDENWRNEAHRLIRQITEEITASMGGSAEIEILPGYPVLYNDPMVTAHSRAFASELLGEEHIIDMDIRMTSEDFAWFSHSYPSMMYRLGVKSPSSEEVFPLHTNTFRVDESALKTGAAMMSWLAMKFLTSNP